MLHHFLIYSRPLARACFFLLVWSFPPRLSFFSKLSVPILYVSHLIFLPFHLNAVSSPHGMQYQGSYSIPKKRLFPVENIFILYYIEYFSSRTIFAPLWIPIFYSFNCRFAFWVPHSLFLFLFSFFAFSSFFLHLKYYLQYIYPRGKAVFYIL